MSITDILEIDLPTIIVLVVLWLLDYFRIRKVDRALEDLRTRPGAR